MQCPAVLTDAFGIDQQPCCLWGALEKWQKNRPYFCDLLANLLGLLPGDLLATRGLAAESQRDLLRLAPEELEARYGIVGEIVAPVRAKCEDCRNAAICEREAISDNSDSASESSWDRPYAKSLEDHVCLLCQVCGYEHVPGLGWGVAGGWP